MGDCRLIPFSFFFPERFFFEGNGIWERKVKLETDLLKKFSKPLKKIVFQERGN